MPDCLYRHRKTGRIWRPCWQGRAKDVWMRSYPDNREVRAFTAEAFGPDGAFETVQERDAMTPLPTIPARQSQRPLIVIGRPLADLEDFLVRLRDEGVPIRRVAQAKELDRLPRGAPPLLVVVLDDGGPLARPPLGADLPHLFVARSDRGALAAEAARIGYAATGNTAALPQTVETVRRFVDHAVRGAPKVAVLSRQRSDAVRLCILLEIGGAEAVHVEEPSLLADTFPGDGTPEVVVLHGWGEAEATRVVAAVRASPALVGVPFVCLMQESAFEPSGVAFIPKACLLAGESVPSALLDRVRAFAASERGLPRWFD